MWEYRILAAQFPFLTLPQPQDLFALRRLTDCKFICLHNSSDEDPVMVGYEMIQSIGNATASYKFTPKYMLKVRQGVMMCASDTGVSSKPPTDLVWKNCSSWTSEEDFMWCWSPLRERKWLKETQHTRQQQRSRRRKNDIREVSSLNEVLQVSLS